MESHFIHPVLEPARVTDSTNEHAQYPDMGEYKKDEKASLESPPPSYTSHPTGNETENPFADFDRKEDV